MSTPHPTPILPLPQWAADEEGAELDGKKKLRVMGELLTTTGEDSGGGGRWQSDGQGNTSSV